MKQLFKRVKPTDLLLTTRWFDVASFSTWMIVLAYATVTMFYRLPTFVAAGAPDWYSMLWSFGVGVSAMIAAFASGSIFYDGGFELIRKKRIERDALFVLIGFMSIYVVLLIVVVAEGHTEMFAQIFKVPEILPLMAFRIHHLNARIRGLLALRQGA